ncbi:hypothetical protein [Desulfogranum marinum]|uniref:hypothetical protein n=1 Tax=Desulfogranum marinum TaxID=453220 RepID=UPI0029C9867A|nr:hypothetical protein [Desulfogranum marinum]
MIHPKSAKPLNEQLNMERLENFSEADPEETFTVKSKSSQWRDEDRFEYERACFEYEAKQRAKAYGCNQRNKNPPKTAIKNQPQQRLVAAVRFRMMS